MSKIKWTTDSGAESGVVWGSSTSHHESNILHGYQSESSYSKWLVPKAGQNSTNGFDYRDGC